ncbi:MAG: hypothetical protein LBP59_10625 [Planctomycetaceae bacterium]|jgi:hypothetical protein|nr:hypothetical protein [Planctomycetaceae bacterium]
METKLSSEEFIALRKKVDTWSAKSATLQGQLNEIKCRLKEEFDVDTLEEAKELQTQLQKQYEQAETKFKTNYDSFTEKWSNLLN